MARSRFLLSLLAVLVLALAGCPNQPAAKVSPADKSDDSKTEAGKKLTAREVIDHTISAYRAALAYRDHGVVRLSYKQDGQALEDSAPLEVQFAMPNRLHLKAYQAEAASDGKEVRAVIRDASTANMDGQVVVRPAPQKLTLDDLYGDVVLRDTLQSGLGRHPVQLELLFGEAPLLDLVKPDAKLALLEPAEIEGHRCHRVEAKLADGAYVFCIDEADYVLRRIEYPADALLPELAKNPGVTDLKVVADFRQAEFIKRIPAAAFALDLPKDGKKVRYFVLPPQELPSNLFGKKPGDFKFVGANGDEVTAESLAGKSAVLIWFANDPLCAWGVQQIKDVLQEATARHKLDAYMIATEDKLVSNDQLAGVLKEWELDLPLLRDFHGAGPDVFGIKQAPTIVILDAEGRVQIVEIGVNPNLKETLPGVFARLSAGDDLAAEFLAGAKKEQEEYAKNLAVASGDEAQTTVVEVTNAEPAAAREPEHFTRTKLWATADKQLAEPGNFLVTHDRDQPRIYVLDGFRTVIELSHDGQTAHKHALDLPQGAGITFLRSAVDKEGRRWFVGSSLLGKQLFVFDADWKVKASYPPIEQEHDGLHAVELADLEGDGTPELYVGFWSLIGLQGVSLEGKWEWTNRVLPNVLSIVATPPNDLGWRKILASGDRGTILRLNQYGHEDPKIEVAKRQIHRLAGASWNGQATAYCGISYLPEGRLQAIGLSESLEEMWNYKLPAGTFNNQIEYVASSRLRADDKAEWLLAGPDGSVHVVSDDGEFFDSFAVGELLTGLTAVKLEAGCVVLTSSKSGVHAWKLEGK